VSSISVVIPTYRRDEVLVDTVRSLLPMVEPGDEIILVDQDPRHDPATAATLKGWQSEGVIRWVVIAKPSIPAAMNCGLRAARSPTVLFLDDDIVPGKDLLPAHRKAHAREVAAVVAGRVVQPWDKQAPNAEQPFLSRTPGWVTEFMGGNFSIARAAALEIGGFDENFVKAAYRYEREFADRITACGSRIFYEPEAEIEHLKAGSGGTRELAPFQYNPGHAVGEYYYLLLSRRERHAGARILARPCKAVRSRYHLRRPWMVPVTLAAETLAFFWAVALRARGPRHVSAASPLLAGVPRP
jgi:GT2 family glycosyltransferase